METDLEIKKFGNDDIQLKDSFKLDYKGQNINKNQEFIKFKKSIFNKYGKKGNIFFCKKNNLYFYYNNQYDPYAGRCPLCKRDICYFCLKSNIGTHSICCFRKRIYQMLTIDAFEFCVKRENILGIDYGEKFEKYLLFALLPFLNMVYFIGGIHRSFYKVETNMIFDVDEEEVYLYDLENYTKGNKDGHCYTFHFIVAMNIGVVIFLTIPFFIYNIIFTILIILISIPFKFYPMKYLFGIGYSCYEVY